MSRLSCEDGPARLPGQRKVCLATTAYENPDASYTYSIARSREALSAAGIASAYLLLTGNCHVDDARNSVVAEFMAMDCTDLVFLDADVCWDPEYLVRLCEFEGVDLIGGVYPYRREGSTELPFRPCKNAVPSNGMIEVEGLPTGFMRINRRVFETLIPQAECFTKNAKTIPLLFERSVRDGVRWGGDINFCRKWRETGGKVFAATEVRLGHATKIIIYDSLGAALRRCDGTTLKHIAQRIRTETEDPLNDFDEIFKANGNQWAAEPGVLALCVGLARRARGPIIEAGSGLSTVLMAIANPDVEIFSLEHDPDYAEIVKRMAAEVEARNISVHVRPLKDNWYDLDGAKIPERYAVGICDGPPRVYKSRMRFFDTFGDRTRVMLADDADDQYYAGNLQVWAAERNKSVTILGRAALVRAA